MSLRLERIRQLSQSEMLQELARELKRLPRAKLNLEDYFSIIASVPLYTLTRGHQIGTTRLDAAEYALVFTTAALARPYARGGGVAAIELRELLVALRDDLGIVIDIQTDAEVRIDSDTLVTLSEYFHITTVREDADDAWLAVVTEQLEREGVPPASRSAGAKEIWRRANGYRVVPRTRRDRTIDRWFAVRCGGSHADQRDRCEERWRSAYAANPYLHHLDETRLRTRLVDLITNMSYLDRGTLPQEPTELEWNELFHDVRFEYERRNIDFVLVVHELDLTSAWPRVSSARNVFAQYDGPPGQLFKFGKRVHLEPLLQRGTLKIFPAVAMNDPALTAAQQDDELARTILRDATKVRFTHTGKDGVPREIEAIGTLEETLRSRTNYYAWYTTTMFDPRLFDDFGADACLIIHRAREFTARLSRAFGNARPDWVGAEWLIQYFDPLRTADKALAGFHKDFRYTYQREYRFLWEPPNPTVADTSLQPVDLDLGNLEEVASLLVL